MDLMKTPNKDPDLPAAAACVHRIYWNVSATMIIRFLSNHHDRKFFIIIGANLAKFERDLANAQQNGLITL